MSTPRKSLNRALDAIRDYFRRHGHSPSLRDLGRVLGCSAPRVHALLVDLEQRGFITRTPGEARSIRLVAGERESDIQLLNAIEERVREAQSRGLSAELEQAFAGIGLALEQASRPLTSLELSDDAPFADLLARLDGGANDGAGEAEGSGAG